MINIRPVSDLRNNFAEISRLVHETGEPVYLTKNGYGDMVVMSVDKYEQYVDSFEMNLKLWMAEFEEKNGAPTYPWDEVRRSFENMIDEAERNV